MAQLVIIAKYAIVLLRIPWTFLIILMVSLSKFASSSQSKARNDELNNWIVIGLDRQAEELTFCFSIIHIISIVAVMNQLVY